MSDKILRALMQLFALVSNSDRLTVQSRNIVSVFLRQQLNQNLIDKYLSVFDDFLTQFQGKSEEGKQRKRLSVSSVKVLKICTEINQELNQKQKYIVLVRLIEYLHSSEEPITEQETEFAKTVSEIFNIAPTEFTAITSFASLSEEKHPADNPYLLQITASVAVNRSDIRQLAHPSLTGDIWILYLKQADILFAKYTGSGSLLLNGQTFSKNTVYVFSNGSVIRDNKAEPIYYSDIIRCFLTESPESTIDFRVAGLQYQFRNGATGLHTLNLRAASGNLIGIMGSSGAGKSTLLNVLNGNIVPTKGEVLINGINIHREKKQLEGVIGFVPQDDLLMEDLTVFQNLFYNSKLCFADLNDEKITEKVNSLLESLGLHEAKDLKVGNVLDKTISGGQRKRLNIALELIRQPPVLFVDEPTSGLSSRDSENVMDLLKQLSITGKLVFIVIHQPSSDIFKLFDKLLLLDTGGYPIYYGNPSESLIYFKRLAHYANSEESECITCGNINPEQLFSIIETKVFDEFGREQHTRKVSPQEWNKYFSSEQSTFQESTKQNAYENSFHKPSGWQQLKVFIKRDVLSKLSNKQYLLINLLEAPVLAIILSFILRYTEPGSEYSFFENINLPAYLFMVVIVSLFLGLTVSAEEIFRDRKILKRESFLNLSRGSYLFSKVSVMFTISAIQSFLFIIIGNSILEIKGMYWDYWLIMFSASCFANMLGLNISSAFNSAVTIYILIPLLIIPQILLSGVIVKFEKLNPTITSQSHVPLLGELMASRWAFEALAVTQFRNNKFEKHFFELDKKMSDASFKTKFWISKLEDKNQECLKLITKNNGGTQLHENLQLLHNEIAHAEHQPSFDVNLLNEKRFSAEVSAKLKNYLKSLNDIYIDQFNEYNNRKDQMILAMQQTDSDISNFNRMQQEYTNESLEDLVLNNNDKVQVLESDGKIIQRYQPVFMDGTQDSFVRSSFYVSRKNIFSTLVDTFLVNLAVMWSMAVTLAIMLYFDLLKKITSLFD